MSISIPTLMAHRSILRISVRGSEAVDLCFRVGDRV
jgi:hypothetical protein